MSKQPVYDYIKSHPLFEGVREESLTALVKAAKLRSYSRNGLVFDTSRRNTRHFFIIMEGCLELNLQNLKKKTMMPGEVFGEVAFFSNDHRTGSVTALEKAKLLTFPRSVFASNNGMLPECRFLILQRLANQIISYLSDYLQRSSSRLVQQPESDELEFKTSFPSKSNHKKNILKTIVAMLNTEGGSIIFGVDNGGGVLGLDVEDKEKMDEKIRSMLQYVDDKLGSNCRDLIDIYGDEIEGKMIARVDCTPSKIPVFAPVEQKAKTKAKKDKKEGGKKEVKAPKVKEHVFYRRRGPQDIQLSSREMVPYLERRFFNGVA